MKTFIDSKVAPFVEKYSFGVCSYLAHIWGLNESRVRLYFIYTSFVSFGSPIVFYLATAFWMNIKKIIRTGAAVK